MIHLAFETQAHIWAINPIPRRASLTGWTTATHQGTGADNITITAADNFYGASPGIDQVTAALPRSLAAGNQLFACLKVVVTQP